MMTPSDKMRNPILLSLFAILLPLCSTQTNRPPEFVRGGDMARFSIREDTPVGTSVYTLRGRDPENTRVFYYISGDAFSAEKDTGVVRLIRPMDREKESTIDVIISISDDKVHGLEPNTISIKREITILDQNDNPPRFQNVPYAFFLDETVPVGTTVYGDILVTDADIGINAEIKLSCLESVTPAACAKFDIQGRRVEDSHVRGEVILKEMVDYEEQSTYSMVVIAEDMAVSGRLNSTTNIVIEVRDVQDQLPVFQNAPFTATVLENSPPGTSVLTVSARDGDAGVPREVVMEIINDEKRLFQIGKRKDNGQGVYSTVIETSVNPIDREDQEILNNGGLYMFQVKAIELVDGNQPGDYVTANVTVVVNDVNDQIPVFSEDEFNITVPEDIGSNTPLPGLNIVVTDADVGENAKFSLHLESVLNSEGVFSVFPTTAVGRTPVIIKVADAERLDYEDPDRRLFIFNVVAAHEEARASTATVTVALSDANDNGPVFQNEQYLFQVPENAPPGTSIYTLEAFDADSGSFGQLTYSLKGFGSDKLTVEPSTGQIKITNCGQETCLDYETQQSYSLTYEAQDGGGKVASVNLFVEIVDVNDNAPQFTRDEYFQEIQENSKKLSPPLFIKATDADGPSQGGGKVRYSIDTTELPEPNAITIDGETGEVTLVQPLKLTRVPIKSNLFTLIVKATDMGSPPLTSEAKLLIKVKKENDGAPVFVNEPYKATVKENAKEGTSVTRVTASDPDGPDSSISYFIENGAKDNFVLNDKSGVISVASGANLDRDIYGPKYHIVIHAVDSGSPLQQTATTTVAVIVEDVNNKPPVFAEESYVKYISESLKVGEEVVQVKAEDPDPDAKVRYSIVEPITARDKTGAVVTSTVPYNYKTAFRIDGTTGLVTLNNPLDYNAASVVIFTVQAIDLNAVDAAAGGQQKSQVEVTIYIRAHSEINPVFAPPWTPSNPKIEIIIPEEALIGSTLLTLSARDPLTHKAVSRFEKVPGSDSDNYVSVSPLSGVVTLNRRLDFEELPLKYISFKVQAIIGDGDSQRSSEATVAINVHDINDNSPVFTQNSYMTSISEAEKYPQTLLTVLASDKDTHDGYGTVRYSVSGDGSDVFTIDGTSGTIQVREGAVLDREQQAVYNLQVTASDSPEGSANQRRTSVLVTIKLVDENDNPPVFSQPVYTALVPENVPIDFSVITVKATDADEGRNGEVQYTIVDDAASHPVSFFAVNSQTGMVTVIRALAGKGRSEPYSVTIRATDRGNPPQYTDGQLLVIVGDVSTNDGVPQFIRPSAGEGAYIDENASVGTSVFQVVAFDPDNPNTANGRVAYKFLDDPSSADGEFEFVIDAATGVISTQAPLDREKKENYTIIVVAHDFGFPPQEAHRVLWILVRDVDDNDPQFRRPLNSRAMEMMVKEEVPVNTIVGTVKATDNDTGVNAVIDYHIIGGNDNEVFAIRRTAENEGEIYIQKRLDHEEKDKYLLTIKVTPHSRPAGDDIKTYDPKDLSEMQVQVIVEDIDDNPPSFESNNYVIGVRTNTEVDTELLTLKAFDPDASSKVVTYSIKNTTFVRSSANEVSYTPEVFDINPKTGVLRNNLHFGRYVNGFFNIVVEARSSLGGRNTALAHVKVYVLHDRDLLKFVFYKRPNEVKNVLPQLKRDLQAALSQAYTLNIYDTQFYARDDGSLDFESTTSCFQLLKNDIIIDPQTVYKILDKSHSSGIQGLYQNYSIVDLENCVPGKDPYTMTWSELFVLVVAAFIAVVAFVVSIVICCLYRRYKKKLKRTSYYHNMYVADHGVHNPVLSPAEQQRIYEWQEMNAPLADAASFRSYPTLR